MNNSVLSASRGTGHFSQVFFKKMKKEVHDLDPTKNVKTAWLGIKSSGRRLKRSFTAYLPVSGRETDGRFCRFLKLSWLGLIVGPPARHSSFLIKFPCSLERTMVCVSPQ